MIGEHGDYPWNEKQQQIFPRKYFMEQICGVFTESGLAVPVFSDKHLSHSWDDATWMVNKMKELGAPFMAGSSMVTAWRRPYVEHPLVSAATVGLGCDCCRVSDGRPLLPTGLQHRGGGGARVLRPRYLCVQSRARLCAC